MFKLLDPQATNGRTYVGESVATVTSYAYSLDNYYNRKDKEPSMGRTTCYIV